MNYGHKTANYRVGVAEISECSEIEDEMPEGDAYKKNEENECA